MQSQQIPAGQQIFDLTVSGQLMFLLETFSNRINDEAFREHYLYTLICANFADLFLFDKISLVNNRIVFNNKGPTNIKYIDHFMSVIITIDKDKTIFDVLMEITKNKILEIESNVKDFLVNQKILVTKHEGFLFFGKKTYQPASIEIATAMLEELRKALDVSQEPDDKLIYLLALLKETDFLPLLYDSKKELDFGDKRLEQLIENNHIAKILSRAIENEIKLRDLQHMPKQRGGNLGMGGGRF